MYANPVFWEQGLFLQPQHFQIEQQQASGQAAALAGLVQPWLWGIRRLVVNEAALNTGVFEITELELFLPTGEHLTFPGNATLPSRSFQQAWDKPENPLTVSLGIAPFKDTGGNVFETDTPESAPDRARFTTTTNPDQIPDLLGNGPRVDVRTLRYNLRLSFDAEHPDLYKIPVARLIRDGDRVLRESRFTPPCVELSAAPVLYTLTRDIRDTLLSRSKQLEEYKIVAGDARGSGISSLQGVTLFCLLGVLSRNAPALEFLLNAPSMHPWRVYGALCQLVGELSVFSASLSPLGETPQGERALPPYDHNNLYDCFSAAASIISRLVDTFVVGPAFTFILEPRNGCLGTVMPQHALGNSYAYWLLLRSSHRANLDELVSRLGKLAPSAIMPGIVARALPGIRLIPADQPPAGLPRRQDTLYYMIDQGDPLWRQILQQGDISFVLPEAPEDLLVQLTVIQR